MFCVVTFFKKKKNHNFLQYYDDITRFAFINGKKPLGSTSRTL